jgi:hypothetical protein
MGFTSEARPPQRPRRWRPSSVRAAWRGALRPAVPRLPRRRQRRPAATDARRRRASLPKRVNAPACRRRGRVDPPRLRLVVRCGRRPVAAAAMLRLRLPAGLCERVQHRHLLINVESLHGVHDGHRMAASLKKNGQKWCLSLRLHLLYYMLGY